MLIWIQKRLASFDESMFLLALLLTFIAAAIMGVQSDTWWQLRTGEIILRTHTIPITDSYSSTVTGAYWPNHEWLSELLFYLLYRPAGLSSLFIAAASIVMLSWLGLAQLSEGPGRVRAVLMLLCMASQAIIWSVRPHLFSMALIVPTLLLLSRPRWHWLYPALFLLWANLHAGVAFGGVVLIVASLLALGSDIVAAYQRLQDFRWRTSASLHWVGITMLSGLATAINPLGFGLWSYILHSFTEPTRSYLTEWQAPQINRPESMPFFLMLMLVILAVLVSWRTWRGKRDWTLILLALIFAWLGLRSIRHTAFLPIVAMPLLSRPFRDWKVLAPQIQRWWLHAILLLTLLLLGITIISTKWAATAAQPLDRPLITALQSCPGTLYNTYDTGGALIWQLPDRPVFIDNRQDPYPSAFLLNAVLVEQTGAYQALFSEYQVQCALISTKKPIYPALISAGWQERGRSDTLVVLKHP